MVRISFTPILFLFATLSSLSLAFPIEPRHFTTLENDLLQLSKAAAVFSSQINSIHTILDPDILGAFLQVLLPVSDDINKCIGDTSDLSAFSTHEADTVISIARVIVPTVVTALRQLVEKQDIFKAYIISGPIIDVELKKLEKSSITLLDDLVDLTMGPAYEELTDMKDYLQAAYEKAIAAYSS
ncbi:hypothetical protein AX14_002263 [Amanita brunnescens Koide BX004]|nr:hypothetical protein AX14_002263 [Amanita brunnescens Koide BX004]